MKQTSNTSNNTPKILSPWMDTEEAAQYMGCKAGSLKSWRSQGKGPRFLVVNRKLVRYHIDDLDAYIRCGDGSGQFISARK